MERLALLAGVNAVAYPAPETVSLAAQRGLAVRFLERCCTILDSNDNMPALI